MSKFENFASNFGVQWRPSDLCDAISMSVDNNSAVRNSLVSIMWDRVVSHLLTKGFARNSLTITSTAQLILISIMMV